MDGVGCNSKLHVTRQSRILNTLSILNEAETVWNWQFVNNNTDIRGKLDKFCPMYLSIVDKTIVMIAQDNNHDVSSGKFDAIHR